jgi:hypothetical protein
LDNDYPLTYCYYIDSIPLTDDRSETSLKSMMPYSPAGYTVSVVVTDSLGNSNRYKNGVFAEKNSEDSDKASMLRNANSYQDFAAFSYMVFDVAANWT